MDGHICSMSRVFALALAAARDPGQIAPPRDSKASRRSASASLMIRFEVISPFLDRPLNYSSK
jgi:hypothetical protein